MSEGRDNGTIRAVRDAGGDAVLDLHVDADHHRTVVTVAGRLDLVEEAARAVVATAVARIDITVHAGVHPRLGAADVVPVVPLSPEPAAWSASVATRDRLADWIGSELSVPCFLYGPERSLPEVRRSAFAGLEPNTGPAVPHPTAGASAVGVRPPLIAYNLWLIADDRESGEPGSGSAPPAPGVTAVARELAVQLRSPKVRALGLPVTGGAQVSCNLLEATGANLVAVHDVVAAGAAARRCRLSRAELVGLVPGSVLAAIPRRRWPELDLNEASTVEARWADAALRPPLRWSPPLDSRVETPPG